MSVVEGVVVDAPTQVEAAKKRGVQAFLQGLAIDAAVGVALLIIAQFDTINSKEGLVLFGISVGKTVIISAAQYIVRRFVDGSGFNSAGEPVGTVSSRTAPAVEDDDGGEFPPGVVL